MVDDMQRARNMLRRTLEEINEEATEVQYNIVEEFEDGNEAFEFIQNNLIDIVFLDVEMPIIDGISTIKKIQALETFPDTIFVTAYTDYSLEAWRTMAVGYVTKPFEKEDLLQVLGKCHKELSISKEPNIKIYCFSGFAVKLDDKVVEIKSKKAEEILAYLVHRHGEWVTKSEIVVNLFEELDDEKAKNSLRTYISRLNTTLKENGIENLIEQSYGKIRANTELFYCDYYEYLEGNNQLFVGNYLNNYSWAEYTLANLYNKMIDS